MHAGMMELADMRDLGSRAERRAGSTPVTRTINFYNFAGAGGEIQVSGFVCIEHSPDSYFGSGHFHAHDGGQNGGGIGTADYFGQQFFYFVSGYGRAVNRRFERPHVSLKLGLFNLQRIDTLRESGAVYAAENSVERGGNLRIDTANLVKQGLYRARIYAPCWFM